MKLPVYSPKAVVDRRQCFALIQETIAQRGAIYKLCQMPCIQQNTVMLTPLLCSRHSYQLEEIRSLNIFTLDTAVASLF